MSHGFEDDSADGFEDGLADGVEHGYVGGFGDGLEHCFGDGLAYGVRPCLAVVCDVAPGYRVAARVS